MKIVRSVGALAVLCIALLTACGPRISDTGYTGTWNRKGLNTETTLAIVNQDGEYFFRWGRESTDNRLQIRCDWDGACEETFDGKQMATYRMRVWMDETSGRLRVECRGIRHEGEEEELVVHYVDELQVRGNGMRLLSRVIENDGQPLERGSRGRRIFLKISDSVVDPPSQSGGRG